MLERATRHRAKSEEEGASREARLRHDLGCMIPLETSRWLRLCVSIACSCAANTTDVSWTGILRFEATKRSVKSRRYGVSYLFLLRNDLVLQLLSIDLQDRYLPPQ